MERFDWPIGFYCPLSSLCGVGLDINHDYSFVLENFQFEPVIEICSVIVDRKKTSCAEFEQNLFDSHFFSREFQIQN